MPIDQQKDIFPASCQFAPIPTNEIFVHVLAPYLETSDDNINYYYDFSQSIAEYTKTFQELSISWKWQPVTMLDFNEIIDKIADEKKYPANCLLY